MNLELVEPLRELFKDEVRELGRELGLPEPFVGRHPSPAPASPSACPAPITRDARHPAAGRPHLPGGDPPPGLYDAIWQAFAVLLPVKTVGVMGDVRTYEDVCALRAVTSVDGMTADFYPFDPAFLGASPPASSTRSRASTASSTTSPASRRGRSSGSEAPNARDRPDAAPGYVWARP